MVCKVRVYLIRNGIIRQAPLITATAACILHPSLMSHCPRVTEVVPDYSSGYAEPSPQFPCQYAGRPTRRLKCIATRRMLVHIEFYENRIDAFVFEYLSSGSERDVCAGNAGGRRLVVKLVPRFRNANAVEWDLVGGKGSSALFPKQLACRGSNLLRKKV